VIRAEKKDELVDHLRECGIEVLLSWPKPMHHHQGLGLKHFHLPETERVSKEVLSLPLYPELGNEQIKFVIELIRDFYSGGCR
jgi:dTDP-4-amino-4,6-dideoxygalactose transaminase